MKWMLPMHEQAQSPERKRYHERMKAESKERVRVTVQSNRWVTFREGDVDGVDGSTCPVSLVPEPYCDALCSTIIMPYYIPDLDAATDAALFQEMFEPLLPMDRPLYLDALASYIRGTGPMPEITVSMPPVVCYPARRQVTFGDGSTGYVSGEACYDGSGGYTFH
ncbi:MAG: hypothetical protein HC902_00780 [Calothrix sp. SM1_5_4]|nr:hypothetical protein [Calothrix sp. SM1_5_4]